MPQWQKEARGTVRNDRPPANEMNFTLLTEAPPAPEGLTEAGREMWFQVCYELMEARRLTAIALPQVLAYATYYDIWKDAAAAVAQLGAVIKFPNGNHGQNPYFKVMTDARRQMAAFEKRWGFDPTSAASLPEVSLPNEELDEFGFPIDPRKARFDL